MNMRNFDEIIDSATHELVKSHGFTDENSNEYKVLFEGRRATLLSDFNDKVDLNNITAPALKGVKELIANGVIEDTKQTAVVSFSSLMAGQFIHLVNFIKDNDELKYHQLHNRSNILIENLTPFKALQLSELLKNDLVYLTLSLKYLEKYAELVQSKVITISTDGKLYNKNKTYKINVRVAANVPAAEANRRKDHYADVILRLSKGLKEKGYDAMIGTSGGNVGHSLTMYTDDIPSLNIFKLYRLGNISIGVRDDLKMVTDEEFVGIFKDLL